MVEKCLSLEGLILNGIKALTDEVFPEYHLMKPQFDEKLYDSIRFDFKKQVKQHRPSELY